MLLLVACGGGSSGGGTTVQQDPIGQDGGDDANDDLSYSDLYDKFSGQISREQIMETASYDPDTQSWTLSGDGNSAVLKGTDINNDNPIDGATRYDQIIIEDGEQIALSTIIANDGSFDYINFGAMAEDAGGFIQGDKTPVDDVPQDLNATYNGKVYGMHATEGYLVNPNNGAYTAEAISGNLNLNVDFAEGTIAGQITEFATNIGNQNLNTVNLEKGKFSDVSSDFIGIATAANTDDNQEKFNGFFKGALYGPNAEEIGGYIDLEGDSGNGIDAGFAGKR